MSAVLVFGAWWCLVCAALGVALWIGGRRAARADINHVLQTFLIGIAAALVFYLVPTGHGAATATSLEMRFLGALAITWLAGGWITLHSRNRDALSAIAFAGFAGVNLPPLAFLASLVVVSGGHPFGL